MQQLRYILATAVSVIALAITGVVAQQPPSAISGAQKLMVVPASKYAGHVYVLPATLETTQWGWFDNAELPRLVIDTGDTVVVENDVALPWAALAGPHDRVLADATGDLQALGRRLLIMQLSFF